LHQRKILKNSLLLTAQKINFLLYLLSTTIMLMKKVVWLF